MQHHVLVQRGVAEQHVEELPGIGADGFRRKRNAHFKETPLLFGDRLDAADDFSADEIVRDRGDRHFDALLDRNRTRARLDRRCIAADVIDRLQTRLHGRLDRPVGY